MESPIYKEIEDVIFTPKAIGKESKKSHWLANSVGLICTLIGLGLYLIFSLGIFWPLFSHKPRFDHSYSEDSTEYILSFILILSAFLFTLLGGLYNAKSQENKHGIKEVVIFHLLVLVTTFIIGITLA